jgi:hypothetical protein
MQLFRVRLLSNQDVPDIEKKGGKKTELALLLSTAIVQKY